ncbi:MAG: efflux RND transporter periplasmic adaptor subunit [Hyphomicrobiaceae bacterium]|nr:efflux RND transporter periplasmic adaptor subunit [Hyphomicrobiaceae bacterium]
MSNLARKGTQPAPQQSEQAAAGKLAPVTLSPADHDSSAAGDEKELESAASAKKRPASTAIRVLRGLLKTILPLAVIALGFAGYKYLKATRPEAPKQAQLERAFAVETVPVMRAAIQPTLRLYGSTVAGRQVDIRALVSGRVIKTAEELRDGGHIAKGDTLLIIDPFDYISQRDEAKAQRAETAARLREQEASLASDKTSLGHAKAQLELTKADVERAEQLSRRGNLSERSLDDRRQLLLQRQQSVDQLENSINVWEARIAQTRLAGERLDVTIARAEKRLTETDLIAPFDAYVTEVAAQVGRMMSNNDKVATLIDRDWIEAQFSITDSQFGRIVSRDGKLEGRPVEVLWTLGGQTFKFPAEISRVAARISSTSGGIDVFARIKDPKHPVPLRPGAFVELALPDVEFDGVIRVPNSALYDGNTVYAVIDKRMDPRPVTVIGSDGNDILVRGDVKDGERIVVTRISTPGKGVLVKELAKP